MIKPRFVFNPLLCVPSSWIVHNCERLDLALGTTFAASKKTPQLACAAPDASLFFAVLPDICDDWTRSVLYRLCRYLHLSLTAFKSLRLAIACPSCQCLKYTLHMEVSCLHSCALRRIRVESPRRLLDVWRDVNFCGGVELPINQCFRSIIRWPLVRHSLSSYHSPQERLLLLVPRSRLACARNPRYKQPPAADLSSQDQKANRDFYNLRICVSLVSPRRPLVLSSKYSILRRCLL